MKIESTVPETQELSNDGDYEIGEEQIDTSDQIANIISKEAMAEMDRLFGDENASTLS